jgi:hypothetical protein
MNITHVFVRSDVRLDDLAAIARARGWQLAVDITRSHGSGTGRLWVVSDEVKVQWSEEITTGVRRVSIVGDDALASDLATKLPHWSRDELLARADENDLPGALDTLRALAMMEEMAFTPELVARYERWARHENRAVRRAVLHLGWLADATLLLPVVVARCNEDTELAEAWTRLRSGLEKRQQG